MSRNKYLKMFSLMVNGKFLRAGFWLHFKTDFFFWMADSTL